MEKLTLIQAAFGFIGLDILTGVTAALYHSELNSRAARNGMFNKIGWSLLIVTAIFINYLSPAITGGEIYIPSIEGVCGMIYYTELTSVIENICRLLPDEVTLKVLSLFRLSSAKFYYLEEHTEEYLEDPEV